MKHAPLIVSSLLAGALALGCANNNAGDHDPTPTTSTMAVHSSSSAASGSDATPGDTAPTTAIVTSGPGGDESTDEGSNFLDPPDLPPMEPLCDQWAQDCPEGQKCVLYTTNGGFWDATKCVPVTGSDQPGEPCSSEGAISGRDSCIEGAICWDVGADVNIRAAPARTRTSSACNTTTQCSSRPAIHGSRSVSAVSPAEPPE